MRELEGVRARRDMRGKGGGLEGGRGGSKCRVSRERKLSGRHLCYGANELDDSTAMFIGYALTSTRSGKLFSFFPGRLHCFIYFGSKKSIFQITFIF